jgi:hypothetical protein
MSNYKEETINGTKYQRARSVEIYNYLDSTPFINFQEETVFIMDGKKVITPVMATISVNFDENGTFPVLNPATGDSTGETATHQQLYALIYSLYIKAAVDRDNYTLSATPESTTPEETPPEGE